MKEFIAKAGEDLDQMTEGLAQIDTDFKAVATFFGEEPKVDPAEFFTIFLTFTTGFNKAYEENTQAVMQAEKIAKREAAKKAKEDEDERRKKATAEGKVNPRAGAGASNAAAKQEAVVDELLSTITAGDAFKNRKRTAGPRKVNLQVE